MSDDSVMTYHLKMPKELLRVGVIPPQGFYGLYVRHNDDGSLDFSFTEIQK